MGASLTVPVTSKAINRNGTSQLRVSACEMQGRRATMEDYISIILDSDSSQKPKRSFMGLFDGHCCELASKWFSENLPKDILQLPDITADSIKKACLEADLRYKTHVTTNGAKPGGTTAVFAILSETTNPVNPNKPFKLVVGNIGDSRCLLARDGKNIEQITKDHKPSSTEEKKRIVAAGGSVKGGRIDDMLAVSRALGDHFFKGNTKLTPEQQKVSAVPDVFEIDGVGSDDIILLICDGVVEKSTNKNTFSLLKSYLEKSPQDPALALSKLLSAQAINSGDNMTVIMIEFKDGSEYASQYGGELEYVPMKLQERSVYRMSDEKYDMLKEAFEHFGARYGHPTGYITRQETDNVLKAKDPAAASKEPEHIIEATAGLALF